MKQNVFRQERGRPLVTEPGRSMTFGRLRRGMLRLAAVGMVALAVTACDRNDDTFTQTVIENHKNGKKTVRLGDLTKIKWDRMCYYGPYSESKAHGIDNPEHKWVILFHQGDKVVGRTNGDRSRLEIVMGGGTTAHPPCFRPDRTAVLHTERKIAHLTLSGAVK